MARKVTKSFITLSLDDIIPYENNPRDNSESVKDVIQSIQQCENLDPIEVDENNVILSGHTRLMALRELGYPETEVIQYTGLSEAKKKKYRLLANKASEKSKWDPQKLKIELKGIDFSGYDFGFKLNFGKKKNDAGYYGDEREKTYNAVNLNEYDESRTAGFYQMPTIKACNFTPDELIGFNYVKTSKEYSCGVHFFLDDYQFERIWNTPHEMIERLKPFQCCLTPDFSLYMDMPMAMKIWNVYRSRLIGQMMQDVGIKVIPTLSWAEQETFTFCFDGLEKGGSVAVSTVGVMRDKEAQKIWQAGMDLAMERLEPKTVLCYGSKIDYDFGDADVRNFAARKFGD